MSKEVKIYPYKYHLEDGFNKAEIWIDKFAADNVQKNVYEYGDEVYLVMVIDDISGNFLYGRFLKLRHDVPAILNTRSGTERKIELLDEENIMETSHFIMNVRDKIILAEYNFDAIRHFVSPLKKYLYETLGTEIEVEPIADTDTFQKLKGEEEIIKFKLQVAKEHIGVLEEQFSLPVFSVLKDLANDNETTFEILVKKGRRRTSRLSRDQVMILSEKLMKKKGIFSKVEIETRDIIYDLVNNNLVSFRISVDKIERRLNSHDFYRQVKELYERQIENIKQMIRTD